MLLLLYSSTPLVCQWTVAQADIYSIPFGELWIQVKESLGGKVRLILQGAAPLATYVETFLRVVSYAHVLQGSGI